MEGHTLADLEPATREWVEYVKKTWVLDAHHERLLMLAAQAWDTAERARAMVERDGMVVPSSRGGCMAHPLLAVAAVARREFATLIAHLNLDRLGTPG